MKIRSVLLVIAVLVLSGCFLKTETKEDQEYNKRQSHIETADVRGHAVCYLNGLKMFDDDFLSERNNDGGSVEIISKDGTIYKTGVDNCFITGLKGKKDLAFYNYRL